MQQINSVNLLEEVISLTSDQRIFIDFPIEIINRLELLGLQISSLDNLFMSYMNNTTEVACELSLGNFKEMYSKIFIEKETLFRESVLECLGTKVYKYILNPRNKSFYNLDTNIHKLIIGKRGEG